VPKAAGAIILKKNPSRPTLHLFDSMNISLIIQKAEPFFLSCWSLLFFIKQCCLGFSSVFLLLHQHILFGRVSLIHLSGSHIILWHIAWLNPTKSGQKFDLV
jgi:hypothetical protein